MTATEGSIEHQMTELLNAPAAPCVRHFQKKKGNECKINMKYCRRVRDLHMKSGFET